MVQQSALAPAPRDDREEERAVLRRQLAGTNIDENSFLATDYLNHFNEVIMLLEMAAEMPDIMEEAWDWQPISYAEHFRRSGFRDKDLAIAAYELAPTAIRAAFDERVEQLSGAILKTLATLRPLCAEADPDPARLAAVITPALAEIKDHVSAINAIIHCGETAEGEEAPAEPQVVEEAAPGRENAETTSQDDIDALFDSDSISQDDIDALFD
ncbi:MAG: hypothetical protein D6740_12245 [Alphaproteobacteria bacterium]|nr:MAG: hypothetical protein D6740_12245 [Alphaproteobacteria bacterium]